MDAWAQVVALISRLRHRLQPRPQGRVPRQTPQRTPVRLALAAALALGFGAGMGLPNAKRVSDSFEIRSTPGKGTTVRVGFALRLDASPETLT